MRTVAPTVLREATWLSRDRAGAYAQIVALAWVVAVAVSPWTAPTMQFAADFDAFWSAARLALQGDPAGAYAQPGRAALAALLGPGIYPAFFYPPVALLLWVPFAFAPLGTAAALWVAISGAAYATAVGAVLGRPARVAALGFSSVAICGLYGQNGLFSAALFGAAAATLDRRPAMAGALLGGLCYKPQLAIFVPLALIVAGHWRAAIAAGGTATALVALATWSFGSQTWAAFVASIPDANAWNAGGAPGYDIYASVFAAVRLLGGSMRLAWTAQALAIATAALAVSTARRRRGGRAEIAMLVAATALAVPFLGEYDLAILAVPGAWLVRTACRTGWLAYERATLATLYILPLPVQYAARHGVPLAPMCVATLFALVWRRSRMHAEGD